MLFDRDHAMEALGRLLIEKGVITEKEVINKLEEVKSEYYHKKVIVSKNGRDKVGERAIR